MMAAAGPGAVLSSTFSQCSSGQGGGAAYVTSQGTLQVSGSTFTLCTTTAGSGGAIGADVPVAAATTSPTAVTVASTTFTSNSASAVRAAAQPPPPRMPRCRSTHVTVTSAS